MANPEHLAILNKGVEEWNEWRRRHRGLAPDLTRTNLSGVNLSGADLMGTYFRETDLSGANLSDVRLNEANLDMVNLTGACLRGAILTGAHLQEANFNNADLTGAYLGQVNLSAANFTKACLTGANLFRAGLCGADLTEAKLSGACLGWADLIGANLSGVDFRDADLRYSQLVDCNLTGAVLTGVKLYGTARDDWWIEGVECEYIFFDASGEIRAPKDRNLAPGEFERLYRTLPTIEYVFQNGMTPLDPLVMDYVVRVICKQNPEYDIKIDSISARGLAPSIKFTVQKEEQKVPALAEVTKVYEAKVTELAARLDEAKGFIQLLIDRPGLVQINATGQYLAIAGSTINIDQHIQQAVELQKAIAEQPENSETFCSVAKRKVMDVIGGAIQDFAKGKVREAAAAVVDVCKDLGPVIVNTTAYAFFKSYLGL